MRRNVFIGSMCLKISHLISDTCDGRRVDEWYKLLEKCQGHKQNVTIISNEEAIEKVNQLIKQYVVIRLPNKISKI